MDIEIPADLVRAYSQGKITRRDIGERLGQDVTFGELLSALHRHDLPLPRFPSDPDAPGPRLIRELLLRAPPHV